MKQVKLGPLYYDYDRRYPPRLRIEPGERVQVETEDAFTAQIRGEGDRRDKTAQPRSNPQTGPILVQGAMPGDTLAVKIESIEPSIGQCATYTTNPKQLSQWLGDDCPHGSHVCPIEDGKIHWSPQVTIPYQPMLGCIATAPDGAVPTTLTAGPHGGNMDIIETCPSNTVYLPVFVEGALLFLGDAHAAMGHGELSAAGLEMPARTVITVNLLKGKAISWPRIESPSQIMTITTGRPMERSIAHAFACLILWMEADYGWPRWKAYDLLTHTGRISVGYYDIGTVAAKVAKNYVESGP